MTHLFFRKIIRSWRFWLGIAISAFFIVLIIRMADWDTVFTAILSMDIFFLLLGIVLVIIVYLIMAIRWQVIFLYSAPIQLKDAFSITMIGYFFNSLLPFRSGDISRAVLMSKCYPVNLGKSISGIVFCHIFDVITLLIISVWVSTVMEIPTIFRNGLIIVTLGVVVIVAIIFLVSRTDNQKISDLFQRFLKHIPVSISRFILSLVECFSKNKCVIQDRSQLLKIFSLSLMHWILLGFAYVFWLISFHHQLPFYVGFFLLVIINFGGSAIPSSPGLIGVYEYITILALSIWIPNQNDCLAFALATHGIFILLSVIIGGFFLANFGFKQIFDEYLHDIKQD